MSKFKMEYPIDPTLEMNPVQDFKRKYCYTAMACSKDETAFKAKFELTKKLSDNNTTNIYHIKSKSTNRYMLAKIYNTKGDIDKFTQKYKEWLFVRQTALIEYQTDFYYNRQTKHFIIIMPYYGPSLYQRIKENGPITDENKVKDIAWDILDKLWIVHNSKSVYCNINPVNIVKRDFNDHRLMDNNPYIDGWKLLDFGSLRRNNIRASFAGTIGWTAPEIDPASKKNRYKPSADIFSFGLLILYILCGHQPLQKDMNKKRDLFLDKRWYKNVVLKSENVIKNKLIKLYYDMKISMDLFELLHDGMLVYDPKNRWDCKRIYDCRWFKELRNNKIKSLKCVISV